MESIAIQCLETKLGQKVSSCGLIIDQSIPYFAASPDGLIGDDCLVEVKCPYSAKDYTTIVDAINDKKIKFLKINKKSDVPELKRTHDYYYQIQGQLHISKKMYCYFVVFSENWIHIEKIVYNDEFWQNEMCTKLTKFYLDCSKSCIIMYLLHAILIPTNKKSSTDSQGKKTIVKYSIQDSQNSFMMIAPTAVEIEEMLKRKYNVGDIEYPIESVNVWLLVQKFFYNIVNKYDKSCPLVNQIINEIKL
ncbi:unnamed protein product [Macrosiphum euphorbiae]|uniref:YqaJ viral recombinase domain-containing protein n=1 Tax=Macrosiphum euphorbiae TaxID=13131 RepID=A0AAV0Y290_9HEMI|nr:unnamed protein product [Macrosiphum euphorbiae]